MFSIGQSSQQAILSWVQRDELATVQKLCAYTVKEKKCS